MGRRDPKCEFEGCTYLAVIDGTACVEHGGVPPARPHSRAPLDHMEKCGARRRDGGICLQPRIRGGNRCRIHGGGAPQVRANATNVVAIAAVAEAARRYGKPRRVSPLEALEEELARSQGHVDWLGEIVAQNHDPLWLSVYNAERDHLSKIAHQMMMAGTDERRVAIAEKAVDQLEAALTGIIKDLGFDPNTEHVRKVIGRHLSLVATNSPTPAAEEDSTIIDAELGDESPTARPIPF